MELKRWMYYGLSVVILSVCGCANINTLLSTEAVPQLVSPDEYGFEKYLTEQERTEWLNLLIPAIKADCRSAKGTFAPETGWPTNRINVSEWKHFYLPEQERGKVIGVASLAKDGTFDNDSQLYDDPAYSRMIYVFLPDYMYACWYPGYAGGKDARQIYYSALLDADVELYKPSRSTETASSVGIRRFKLSEDGCGETRLKMLKNVYAANAKFINDRNDRIKKAEEQVAKQAYEKKVAELEKQAKAILAKNEQACQKNISLKGIYIGMPIDEARTLLSYNFRGAIDALGYFYLAVEEEGGYLSTFAMDGVGTKLLFDIPSITGEELAQQLADKYRITLEVDAYGKAWQYRDSKRGMKIQIGGDGSVKMEKHKSLFE